MKLEVCNRDSLPTVQLNPRDLRSLAKLLEGYLAYLRGALVLSRKYAAQILELEALRQRLISVPLETKETRFMLTVYEIEALDRALEGFMWLYQRNNQQSQVYDAGLQQLGEFRQELSRMLSS